MIDQWVGKDQVVWKRLCDAYAPLVYAWARIAGLQEVDASRATIDVLRVVATGIEQFRSEHPSDSLRDWLLAVTREQMPEVESAALDRLVSNAEENRFAHEQDFQQALDVAKGLFTTEPDGDKAAALLDTQSFTPGNENGEQVEGWKSQYGDRVVSPHELNESLSGYTVHGLLGLGGMGAVYQATELELDREVALKLLTGKSSRGDDSRAARFSREAQLTAKLDHPSIVPVYGIGYDNCGRFYYSMRRVRGRELKEILRLANENRNGWNRSRVVAVMVRICQAIAFAHAKGVVHRDLKPANVMVGELGEVYVMDWGLARTRDHDDMRDIRLRVESQEGIRDLATISTQATALVDTTDRPLMTMDGTVVGTPAYMPPEQALGKVDSINHFSDTYALGAIMYEILAGQPPYVLPGKRSTKLEILQSVLAGPPQPITYVRPDAPAELVAICEKAMAREQSNRYATTLDMADDLQAFLDDRVVKAHQSGAFAEARKWVVRNRGVAVAGLAALLLAILGVVTNSRLQTKANQSLFEAGQETEIALRNEKITSGKLAVANVEITAAKKQADEAAIREERAKNEALARLAESYANFGEQEAAADRHAHASLWFTNAAQLCDAQPELQHAHLVRAMMFGRAAPTPIATYWDRDLLAKSHWLTWPEPTRFIFSPSNQYVLMRGTDEGQRGGDSWKLTRILDMQNTQRQLWSDTLYEAAAFSPNGVDVAVATTEGPVSIRRLSDEQPLQTLPQDETPTIIRVLEFSHDGHLLFVGSSPARIWDVVQQRYFEGSYGDGKQIVDVGFSHGDQQLLTLMQSGEPRLYEVADKVGPRKPIATTESHSQLRSRFTFRQTKVRDETFPDGTPVREQLLTRFGYDGGKVKAFALDSTGNVMAKAHGDGLVRLWRIAPPRPYWFIPTDGWARPIINPDSTLIAAVGHDDVNSQPAQRSTQVYEFATESPVGPTIDVGVPIVDGCFSRDNSQLVLACAVEGRSFQTMLRTDDAAGSIQFWDWKAGSLISRPIVMPSEPRRILWHPTKNLVVVACAGGEILSVDPDSFETKIVVKNLVDNVIQTYSSSDYGPGISFDAEGKHIAQWGFAASVYSVIEFDSGKTVYTSPDSTSNITGVEFRGNLTLAARHSGRARFFRWKPKKRIGLIRGDVGRVAHLSSDGMYAIAGSPDATGIVVWDINADQPACPQFGKDSTDVNFIEKTPFVIATSGREIQFWDRLSGRMVAPSLEIPACEFLGFLRVASNGQFAVMSCRPYGLLVCDLRSFFEDPRQGLAPADLVLLAEINSAAWIRSGRMVEMNGVFWMPRWDEFMASHPDFFSKAYPASAWVRDHLTRAQEFDVQGMQEAAQFHRRQAGDVVPLVAE